jgi:hypothetical protein
VEDLLYVVLMVVFVLVSILFVIGCDRMIGPDEEALAEDHRGEPEPEAEKVAA